jgi:hypothetical protein
MRRISLPLLLLVAGLLVIAGCGGKSKSSSSGGSSSAVGAELAPASATAFISVNTDSSGAQWKQLKTLLASVPALQTSLDKSISKSGITLTDVEQALGPVTDVVVQGTGTTQTAVMLTAPEDTAKLKSLLAKSSSKQVTTTIEGWLASSETQAALDEFKSAVAKGKLSDSSSFKEAMDALPEDALARAYIRGEALTDLATSSMKSSSSSALTNTLGTKNKVDWIALAASAVPEGLSIEGAAKGVKGLSSSATSTLIDKLPSGAAFAVDLNGKTVGLDQAVTNLRDNDKYRSQIAQIEALLGMKLEDLAALAGSEMAIYGGSSGIGVLIKAPDAAKASALVEKVGALMSAQSGGQSQKVTVAGVQALELTFSNIKVYLGIDNGNLFLTTDANGLLGSGKLTSDQAYTTATGALSVPSESLGVLYVDFAGLATFAESNSSLLQNFGGSSTVTSSMSNLEGLSSLLGYATASGDKVEFKAMLATK